MKRAGKGSSFQAGAVRKFHTKENIEVGIGARPLAGRCVCTVPFVGKQGKGITFSNQE